jgi:hypothetical protein
MSDLVEIKSPFLRKVLERRGIYDDQVTSLLIVERYQRQPDPTNSIVRLMLTAISGFVGLAGAYGVTRLLGLAPPIDGFELPHIYPTTAALAIISLATAGIIAGLYPARRAAMLTPVEALRQE